MDTWQIVIAVVAVALVVGVIAALVQAKRAKRPPIPADWYPDQRDPSLERYHDGNGWTDQTRPNKDDDY